MDHVAEVEERERLLLTVVEAATMLGVGRTKAYELIAGGELQVVHIGRAARGATRRRAPVRRGVVVTTPRTMRRAPRHTDASQPPLPFIDLTKD
ncbi:MAG: hypothetical protein QOI95_2524 [Acidimicrobiaceae bacterium]|jgi:excisionase family DNA binding protein